MPQDVINRVQQLARKNPPGLEFQDRNRIASPDTVDFDDGTSSRPGRVIDSLELQDQPVTASQLRLQGPPPITNSPDQAVDPVPPITAQNAGVNIPVQHDLAVQDPHRPTGVGQHNATDDIARDDDNNNASFNAPSEPDDDNSVHTAGVDEVDNQPEHDNQSPTTTQRNRTIKDLETEMDKQYGTQL